MNNAEHVLVIKQGVVAWNAWRSENFFVKAELSNVDLAAADLSGAMLIYANLDGAYLRHARLTDAALTGLSLRSANLEGADLSGKDTLADVDLRSSKLKGANFRGRKLVGVDFSGADLTDADFSDTTINWCRFGGHDLRSVRGLDTIKFEGPSEVAIDTIYRSKGKIPESFLRGCGVPENLIRYIPSLVNAEDGIQFYSCFISYSAENGDFAKRLHGQMRDAHLRVWFAPEDMKGGKKLHEQIETAIRVYDKLLIVLSEASLQSEWVMDELRKGFKAERDTGKRKLFPVRLIDYETLERWECRDSLSGKDLAEEVRQYFIPDFSNWKDHDPFEAVFDRLLKDLRADSNSA